MWLLLKNGRVIDPSCDRDEIADLLIEDGRVARIGKIDKPAGNGSGEVYDVSGLCVAPGLIDMHTHLREPGYEHKETIETAAMAAAAGGFTTVVGMPNTKPAVDTAAIVEFILNRGERVPINVLTTGAATKANEGKEMAEIGDIIAGGAVAISDDAFPIQSSDLMRRIMEYTAMFDVPILTHCEDKSMTADAIMNEGVTSTILGLRPWPRQAEDIMVCRNILLSELTDCKLHIQHVTTRGAVAAVRWGKSRGIRVTAETCPHYFTLTDEALANYDTNAKVNPPLRTADDVSAVKEGLADGTIDAIATDHAPHAQEEKEVELQYAAFGIVGLETCLALTLTNAVHNGAISLVEAIRKLTETPAKILGIDSGCLRPGYTADVVVFDSEAKWTVDSSKFKSKGKNTPVNGMELTGQVVATVCWGDVVYGESKLKRIKD